ncbi:MAG TPA: hypothetical protein ENG73_10250 [Desulfobacterales bacterium]|nr:hypothetical protein [Desulfobacterales bacterium]
MGIKKLSLLWIVLATCVFAFVTICRADYVYSDTKTNGSGYATIGFVSKQSLVRKIDWEHDMGGYPECSNGGQDLKSFIITLEVTTDDVDKVVDTQGNIWGEFDSVYISQDQENWSFIGQLTQMESYTLDEGYVPGPGHGDNLAFLCTSVFDLSSVGLDLTQKLYIKVSVQKRADLEIEKSVLTVRCSSVPIPTSVWLLGSGFICLVGVSRKLTTKKGRRHS